jgi:hypothetical protein
MNGSEFFLSSVLRMERGSERFAGKPKERTTNERPIIVESEHKRTEANTFGKNGTSCGVPGFRQNARRGVPTM